VLSVLVVLDELLDEVQDMKMKLKRNVERRMSKCFTWFPIGVLGEPNIYHDSEVFYNVWCFLTWWYFWWVFVLGGVIVLSLFHSQTLL